jgi:hypothetical protein
LRSELLGSLKDVLGSDIGAYDTVIADDFELQSWIDVVK